MTPYTVRGGQRPFSMQAHKKRGEGLSTRPSHGSKFVHGRVHGLKAPSEAPFRSSLCAGLEL